VTLCKGDILTIRDEKYIVEGQPDYALQYLDGINQSTVIFLKLKEVR
jgi:hypothetical protein